MRKEFSEYISTFSNLPIEMRRAELVNEILSLTKLVDKVLLLSEFSRERLVSREMVDFCFDKDSLNESKFLDVSFAYVKNLEDMLSAFFNSKLKK